MKAYVCVSTVLGIAFFGALAVAADFPQAWETSRIADSLKAQEQVTFDRIEAKQQLVEDVIADRMTLTQAADKFGELNSLTPETMSAVQLYFAGANEKESLCREVFFRVKVALEERTAEAERVMPRLKSEMHEQFSESSSRIE